MAIRQILLDNFYLVQCKRLQVAFPNKRALPRPETRVMEKGWLGLRCWRTEGALASSNTGQKCSWWSFNLHSWRFFKKRGLIFWSDSPKNSSVKPRDPKASHSHSGLFLKAVQRLSGVLNIGHPLRNADFHPIHHGGCNSSLYYQNVHCR